MSNALEVIQAKVKQLHEVYNQRKSYHAQIKDNIVLLKAELAKTADQLKEIEGGLQAYNESIKLLTPEVPAEEQAEVATVEVVTEEEAQA